MTTPPLRAVVFDFDGVILESTEIKTRAFADLFADRPEHREAILRHHLENVGLSRYRKFEWIYRELFAEPLSDEASRQLGERYSAIALEQVMACPMVPGARQVLADLVGKLPAFVASGTPQVELRQIVAERGLGPYFAEVHGAPRPKEAILEDLLQRHRLAPREVVMVGDGMTDLRAAQAVGTRFVGRELGSVFAAEEVPRVADLVGLRPHLGLPPGEGP
ncbi:MAG: HAD family hydrolase [Acidobacteriota bacterium]